MSSEFLKQHQLPDTYLKTAEDYFSPLIKDIVKRVSPAKTHSLIIGICGSQGSGKSTLAAYIEEQLNLNYGISALRFSLDDFYLSSKEREVLSEQIHPLLKSRGVPGTHDLKALLNTLSLLSNKIACNISIPQFNKLKDNPGTPLLFEKQETPVQVVIIEGWCLGVPKQDADLLKTAINKLEINQDSDGQWRHWVNEQLGIYHERLSDLLEIQVFLKVPSWEQVLDWREEQELKLAERSCEGKAMNRKQLEIFISYFQRITEHALKIMPTKCHYLFELNSNREIVNATMPTKESYKNNSSNTPS